MAKGVQANWIHRGEKRPANPVRRHPAKSVCTRVRMIMTLEVDVTAERRHYNTHRPPKGETTHYILCVASAPSPTAVTDLLDFQVADAPLQIQFASANHVCCASLRSGAADWRSGPRWSILSVLCPVHPFPLRGTSPRWEACHWIFRSLRSLTNPVPLPPQGETRDMERKTGESYTSRTISAFSPFGGCRHHLARWEACHMTLKVNPVTLTL